MKITNKKIRSKDRFTLRWLLKCAKEWEGFYTGDPIIEYYLMNLNEAKKLIKYLCQTKSKRKQFK